MIPLISSLTLTLRHLVPVARDPRIWSTRQWPALALGPGFSQQQVGTNPRTTEAPHPELSGPSQYKAGWHKPQDAWVLTHQPRLTPASKCAEPLSQPPQGSAPPTFRPVLALGHPRSCSKLCQELAQSTSRLTLETLGHSHPPRNLALPICELELVLGPLGIPQPAAL